MYCIALGSTNPSLRLCICPWDAAKQPDSAGDWHPLPKPPREKRAAAMLPHQLLQRREDWKSSGSRTELTNLPCITASVLSLSLSPSAYPPAGSYSAGSARRWKRACFFPVIEEAVMTVMLKDEPGPLTPPSLNSTKETYLSCYLRWVLPEQLLVGWRLERCWVPLPALPPPTRYKARLLAAFPANSTRPWVQVVPQLPVARPCCHRKDPMSCWMPGCPALSMCRGLAALPITCLER